MEFTKSQRAAVETDGRTLLVSAGAGSGKTTVLTERIMRRICDAADPCDITDFLVVTFTRASAADLVAKITDRINSMLAVSPSAHLARQLVLLGRAQISTMHSFCLDMVRRNFQSLSIPARFRLADGIEAALIKKTVCESMLDDYFDPESAVYKPGGVSYAEFTGTAKNFLRGRGDGGLYDAIMKIYEKTAVMPDQTEYFERLDDEWACFISRMEEDADISGTLFGAGFCEQLRLIAGYGIEACGKLCEYTAGDDALEAKYGAAAEVKRRFLEEIISGTDGAMIYGALFRLAAGYTPKKVGSRGARDDIAAGYAAQAEKQITKIRALLSYNSENLIRTAREFALGNKVFSDMTRRLGERLFEEKCRRGAFDFGDLERFTLRLLTERSGGGFVPSALAAEIRGRYKEICIDEYQDTNKVQDMIFRAISTEDADSFSGNRFMVGDIKQSIYAFRAASPGIFAGYAAAFPQVEGSSAKSPAKIYLSENFRSEPALIGFVNYLFGSLFAADSGGVAIDYRGTEAMTAGRAPGADDGASLVVFSLIETADKSGSAEEHDGGEEPNDDLDISGEPDSQGEEGDESEGVQLDYAESEYIAQTIAELVRSGKKLDGTAVSAGDIAILTRDHMTGGIMSAALSRYGVPNYKEKLQGFLSSAEIMLMLSLLRALDNPYRDIPLAAVLKSQIFSFDADDFVNLVLLPDASGRQEGRRVRLYSLAAQAAAEDSGAGEKLRRKCADFMAKFADWQKKSRMLTADRLIWYLYRDTGLIYTLAGEERNGERASNLLLLHEYAKKFEQTGYYGLFGFLAYIDDVRGSKSDLERAKMTAENSGVVRIMTVHNAKGLEFPVVFAAGLAKRFSGRDYREDPVFSERFGISYKLLAPDGMGVEDTTLAALAKSAVRAAGASEELRILYVALTRAKERLYLSAGVRDRVRYMAQHTRGYGTELDALLRDAVSYADLITPLVIDSEGGARRGAWTEARIVTRAEIAQAASERAELREAPAREDSRGHSGEDGGEPIDPAKMLESISGMYSYRYPSPHLSSVPAKLSVSQLHPGILDDDEYRSGAKTSLAPMPSFMETEEYDPALTGTAMHLFMQFADFKEAREKGAECEGERLAEMGFITAEQYARLNFKRLDAFFCSALCDEITAAAEVYREVRFNLRVPAADFTENTDGAGISKASLSGEFILIQGVIDLFFITAEHRLYVVDFKTDAVKNPDGEAVLIERHGRQLEYYCAAAEEMTALPVKDALIYSFSLGRSIILPAGHKSGDPA